MFVYVTFAKETMKPFFLPLHQIFLEKKWVNPSQNEWGCYELEVRIKGYSSLAKAFPLATQSFLSAISLVISGVSS